MGKWRARLVEQRLDGLSGEPRPGPPSSVTADQVEGVVVATLESAPEDATHWSRRGWPSGRGCRSPRSGGSGATSVSGPHRTEGFRLSTDPLLVEKVYDVGLYLEPPEAAVGLSVDEKSRVQALARSQPAFAMMPGMPRSAPTTTAGGC